jgi:hypothetical protein
LCIARISIIELPENLNRMHLIGRINILLHHRRIHIHQLAGTKNLHGLQKEGACTSTVNLMVLPTGNRHASDSWRSAQCISTVCSARARDIHFVFED